MSIVVTKKQAQTIKNFMEEMNEQVGRHIQLNREN